MPKSAKDITIAALKLLGHINSRGAVDENREARFFGVAPSYIDQLQNEILMRENYYRLGNTAAYQANDDGSYTPLARPTITNLDDVLACSDDSAERVLPYGLAMYFAAIDGDIDSYNRFSQDFFGNKLPTVVAVDEPIEDYYNAQNDPDFQ